MIENLQIYKYTFDECNCLEHIFNVAMTPIVTLDFGNRG